uniref:Cuticle protein 16.5 n=1 Tax=Bactrocera latifrons TaxID=174628 RepID=A0A0K8VNY7_BACLA
MAFKVIFVLAALVACAHARPGGPAAYSISAPSVDHASVGSSQEHTVKGHYGQSSQSEYSSAVQTAHSQSHVQRSSISNDAGLAPHVGGHIIAAAAPIAHAYAAPTAYAAHAYTAPAATISHGYAAPALALAHSAPALSHGITYAAPAASYHAPAYSASYHAPAYSYAAPSYSYQAPSIQYAAATAPAAYGHYAAAPAALSHSYVAAAPAATLKYASAPAYVAPAVLGHAGIAHGLPLAAPALAPLAVKTLAAPGLVHTAVAGHGVHYGY